MSSRRLALPSKYSVLTEMRRKYLRDYIMCLLREHVFRLSDGPDRIVGKVVVALKDDALAVGKALLSPLQARLTPPQVILSEYAVCLKNHATVPSSWASPATAAALIYQAAEEDTAAVVAGLAADAVANGAQMLFQYGVKKMAEIGRRASGKKVTPK